jgi:MSHA biogenesis protein MshK
MAERLNAAGVCGFLIALAAPLAGAQQLRDPTRPPNVLASDVEADVEVRSSQLQSVLISRGRKLAVINGQTVPLGGSIGDAKLVRITETAVVLQRGEETETLRMFEGTEKKSSARQAARAKGERKTP